ncbi:response regulator transcription factor [Thermosynechococcus sp. PKX82]|uniref:response regulator transcription factor n=1 Tax=Thermosynechococcus sp. PKX82 TaxID=3074086 RepID=UPI002872EADF|nr:response regulator transcription factor [Thermosynechococcus sp. PKX82]WNC28741.1 response regulator transcription factor [Thermosynechococcus sp. PKX82]
MKILIVEDDQTIANLIAESLAHQRYTPEVVHDAESALEYLEATAFDLLILDLGLPRMDGLRLCQILRQRAYQLPILILTARNTSTDKVMGLDAGADDYLVKPFDLAELLARVRALLRRQSLPFSSVLRWGALTLYLDKAKVTYNNQELQLTPKEYAILEVLLRNGSRILSRSAIIDHAWSLEEVPGEEAVKVHLKRLRHKLNAGGAPPNFIETVYGFGYRLNPNFESPS